MIEVAMIVIGEMIEEVMIVTEEMIGEAMIVIGGMIEEVMIVTEEMIVGAMIVIGEMIEGVTIATEEMIVEDTTEREEMIEGVTIVERQTGEAMIGIGKVMMTDAKMKTGVAVDMMSLGRTIRTKESMTGRATEIGERLIEWRLKKRMEETRSKLRSPLPLRRWISK